MNLQEHEGTTLTQKEHGLAWSQTYDDDINGKRGSKRIKYTCTWHAANDKWQDHMGGASGSVYDTSYNTTCHTKYHQLLSRNNRIKSYHSIIITADKTVKLWNYFVS